MNILSAKMQARLDELLLIQALTGLTADQTTELEALQHAAGNDNNPYMETAALIQLGFASMDSGSSTDDSMPEQLRQKLRDNAITTISGNRH